MKNVNGSGKERAVKCFLPVLLVLCIIAMLSGVKKTYAVVTVATNVSVNTFYGEGEAEAPEDDKEDDGDATDGTETADTDTGDADETDADDTGSTDSEDTEDDETESSSSGSSSSSSTVDADSAQTNDSSNMTLWIVIAAAALICAVAACIRIYVWKRHPQKEKKER